MLHSMLIQYTRHMADSLDRIGLSLSNYDDEDFGCMFCEESDLCYPLMISTALNEKHSNGQDVYYARDINDILEDRLCEPTVKFIEMVVLADDEEFLKRQYATSQYNRKITALGEYYKFHKDIPRIHAMPVQRTLAKHYDRRRQLEYKQVKKLLKQDGPPSIDSMLSLSGHSSFVRKSKYSTMLADVKKSFERQENEEKNMKILNNELVEKSQSVALFEVYDKLSEIVKAVPEMPQIASSYLQNSGVRNFQNWIKKSLSKKKTKLSNSIDPSINQPDFSKKKVEFSSSGSKKKLILKYSNRNSVYNTLNLDYKKILETKHMTAGHSNIGTNSTKTQIQRPLMKMTEYMGSVPLRMSDKERSIEKIYGVDLTTARQTRVFQRIITSEKRYQDSTNGSSNRIDFGKSKSIDKVVIDKLYAEKNQQQNQSSTKEQPKKQVTAKKSTRNTRSLTKITLTKQHPLQNQKTERQERTISATSTSKPKYKKSVSVPAIKHDIRIGRPKSIDTAIRKATIDVDLNRKRPKKSLNQFELMEIAIEKKIKVDPTSVYKKLKSIK